VSYRSFEDLLALLHGSAPAKVDAVAVVDGVSSLGAVTTDLGELSIDVELKKIARVVARLTRSRRDRTHETQADHVKAFGESIKSRGLLLQPRRSRLGGLSEMSK
jgi:hypothetical protein